MSQTNTYTSVSKTINYKDGGYKTVRIKEVENGWIICIDKRYKDESDEWKYEEKEYISSKNPMVKEEKEASEAEDIVNEVLKNL